VLSHRCARVWTTGPLCVRLMAFRMAVVIHSWRPRPPPAGGTRQHQSWCCLPGAAAVAEAAAPAAAAAPKARSTGWGVWHCSTGCRGHPRRWPPCRAVQQLWWWCMHQPCAWWTAPPCCSSGPASRCVRAQAEA
jgi:hypothetical protein